MLECKAIQHAAAEERGGGRNKCLGWATTHQLARVGRATCPVCEHGISNQKTLISSFVRGTSDIMEQRSSADGIRWDLSDLYAGIDDPKIDGNLNAMEERAKAFETKYRDVIKPGISPGQLSEAVIELEEIYQGSYKTYMYSQLVFAGECTKPENGALIQKAMERLTDIKKHMIFFELAWCKIEDDEAETLMNSPEVVKYKHYLEVERLKKPHKLSEPEEKLWDALDISGRAAFVRLFDETMGHMCIEMEEDGEMKCLTLDAALMLLKVPDREKRIAAHRAVTKSLDDNMPLLTFIFNNLVQNHFTHDSFRSYSHPMAVRNMSNEVDDATVESLLAATDKNVGMVARYYNLKKRIIGLDPIYDYDRYAPILEMKKECTYEEARKMVLESYANFTPLAGEIAQKFFDHNWIDAELRLGKEGGAFSAGITPDVHPYIMLNHTDDLSDAMTMAHELGHGIHQYLAREQGMLQMNTSLAMAETASVMGEMILFHKLLAQEEDPKLRLSLLCAKIEDIFATAFRQVMMTRFEKRLHEHRRTKGELKPEELHAIWTEQNKWMFGDSCIMTEDYGKWWSYVLHFVHYPFYTYAYAFGELMVLSLYEEYRRSGDEFVGKYLELLKAGGSDFPKNTIAKMGLDITDPGFWQKGFDLIDEMVKQAEELAAEVGY